MRKHLVSALMLLAFWPGVAGQTLDVAGHVDRSIKTFFSPDATDAQCTDALLSLLDAIVKAAEDAPLGARIAWVAFPLLTVALMAVTLLMILTPMTRRA